MRIWSTLMEGHLHSARFAYKELAPDILESEIREFADLKKKLNGIKNKKAA